MSVSLYPGIKRLHLLYSTRYDAIRTTDIRDDLVGVKVWISTTQGFNPQNITPIEYGVGASITIDNLEINTLYYVRYAFISKIDPTVYTISSELSARTYDELTRVYGELTNDPHYLVRSENSNTPDWSYATGTFRVWNYSTEVTAGGASSPADPKGPVYSVVANSATNGITATINSTTGVFSATSWSGTTRAGKVTFKAIYDGIEVLRDWEIVDGIGQDAPQVRLTSVPNNFVYDDANAVLSKIPQVVYTANLTNLTGTPTFTVQGYRSDGTVIGNIVFTQSNNVITITNAQFHISNDIAYAVITATLGTATDTDILWRLNNGSDVILVDVSNPIAQLQASETGAVDNSEYVDTGTTIEVYEGSTKLAVDNSSPYSPGTWTITSTSSTGITPDTTPTINQYSVVYDQHSNMTQDTASIDYTISYVTKAGVSGTRVVTQKFSKSKQGVKGDTGATGATGATGSSAKTLDIGGNLTNFKVNAAGLFSPSNATLEAVVQNITSPSYSWTITNATPASSSASSVTITPSNSNINFITVTLTVTEPSTSQQFTKTVTLSVAYDGQQGQVGQAGLMSAFPTIYRWSSSEPSRPSTSTTYTWSTGTYGAPSGWYTYIPTDTTPGNILWGITIPLTVSGDTTSSTLSWSNTTYQLTARAYNGTNGQDGQDGQPGAQGTSGSATFVVTRTSGTGSPTNAEVSAVIGRNPVNGDIVTVTATSTGTSQAYRYISGSWSVQTTYITGSLVVENSISGSKIIANTIQANRIQSGTQSNLSGTGFFGFGLGTTVRGYSTVGTFVGNTGAFGLIVGDEWTTSNTGAGAIAGVALGTTQWGGQFHNYSGSAGTSYDGSLMRTTAALASGNNAAIIKMNRLGGSPSGLLATPVSQADLGNSTTAGNFSKWSYTSSSDAGTLLSNLHIATDSYAIKVYLGTSDLLATTVTTLAVGTSAVGSTGEIRATGNITAYYSDDRLKIKLGTISNALDKLCTLSGFYYRPNEVAKELGYQDKGIEVGISAQGVQKVLPEIVTAAPISDEYLTVRYDRLAPLFIEAIKELRTELTYLKELIDANTQWTNRLK